MSITISNHHRTLKCVTLRFGKYTRHRRDTSPTNDHQWDLDGHSDPCAFQKICYRWTVNIVSYSFCFAILAVSEIWSSVSWYLVRSRYRHSLFTRSRGISSPWPSHKLQLGCNLTKWAQSIFPSRGRTNPDLDTYTSTYPFRIPEQHLFDHPVMVWPLMQSRQPLVIVIRYDLRVKGVGYYAFLLSQH